MVKDVAVIHKATGDIGIAKIHAQGHAGIGPLLVQLEL